MSLSDPIRIVCISDTHNDDCSAKLPNGDILIHAGDMTDGGTMEELQKAYNWISKLPHKLKIVVAGELQMLNSFSSCRRFTCVLLQIKLWEYADVRNKATTT